ncbi:hypothetical protein [Streptomyces sp. NBC_01233]|uniref:hypothetical protein n=1 Tax=Streptomyces sp. NBC_01233 TaxID=2903787 RepID=UPI002E1596FF|nr:hypothetical protein OG332_33020 [Streptomyces sp. NBC_01233]
MGKGEGFVPTVSIEGEVIGSAPGRAVMNAQFIIQREAVNLINAWEAWRPESSPHRWLYDMLMDAQLSMFDNQYTQVDFRSGARGDISIVAGAGFRNTITIEGQDYGPPNELATWKAIGDEAVRRWENSVQGWLSAAAADVIVAIDSALRAADDPFGQKVTDVSKGSLTALADEAEAKKEKEDAKKEKEDAKKEREEVRTQNEQDRKEAKKEQEAAKEEARKEREEVRAQNEQDREEAQQAQESARAELDRANAEALTERNAAEQQADQQEAAAKQEFEREKAEAEAEREQARQEADAARAESQQQLDRDLEDGRTSAEDARREFDERNAEIDATERAALEGADRREADAKGKFEEQRAEAQQEREDARKEAEQARRDARAAFDQRMGDIQADQDRVAAGDKNMEDLIRQRIADLPQPDLPRGGAGSPFSGQFSDNLFNQGDLAGALGRGGGDPALVGANGAAGGGGSPGMMPPMMHGMGGGGADGGAGERTRTVVDRNGRPTRQSPAPTTEDEEHRVAPRGTQTSSNATPFMPPMGGGAPGGGQQTKAAGTENGLRGSRRTKTSGVRTKAACRRLWADET